MKATTAISSVNALLTSGVVVACYYASHPDAHVARPDCQGLASVRYGPIALLGLSATFGARPWARASLPCSSPTPTR